VPFSVEESFRGGGEKLPQNKAENDAREKCSSEGGEKKKISIEKVFLREI